MDIFNQPRLNFRVASGPCHTALIAWRERRLAVEKQHFDFAKSVGGTGFYPGSEDNVGNGVAIHAVIFEGDLPAGWKVRKWKSFNGLSAGMSAGWPDKRTKIGKEALAVIRALPLRPSCNAPCDEIGFPTSLSYTYPGGKGSVPLGMFETLKAGWIEDVFYVSLPDYQRIGLALQAEGKEVERVDWLPLVGMQLVLKEQVDLDYARHKAATAATAEGGAA